MDRKFYITTSIAYVNAAPHIGFALELVQADVLARWHRQKGEKVFFLTGTDEHGAKVARAAEAAGKTPRQLVDENAEQFRLLKKALNLSWDNFIRTSDQKNHWPAAEELWKRLVDAGDLYKKTYRGLYCVGHEAFVTKKDLVRGKCADHQKEPEVLEEENWFFRLSRYTDQIKNQIDNGSLQIIPESRRNEILALLAEGLEDVSFSRPSKDLSWGVPVPEDSTQTMYVWADALSNYISGYACPPTGGADSLAKWQEHPADIHIIGKDILRFHAAIWPAMLLSAKLPLPKAIFVHGHILSGGQKMSKSLGNVVDPFELVEKYGTDATRYFLLREIPSTEDGDFTYEKFEERYNGDLANGIGNFAARVLTLAERDTNIRMHTNDTNNTNKLDGVVEEKIKEIKQLVAQKLDEFKLHEALTVILDLARFGDQYINEKKPWEQKRPASSVKYQAIFNLIVILDNVAALLSPFLPETAEKITKVIVWEGDALKIQKIKNLFPRFVNH